MRPRWQTSPFVVPVLYAAALTGVLLVGSRVADLSIRVGVLTLGYFFGAGGLVVAAATYLGLEVTMMTVALVAATSLASLLPLSRVLPIGRALARSPIPIASVGLLALFCSYTTVMLWFLARTPRCGECETRLRSRRYNFRVPNAGELEDQIRERVDLFVAAAVRGDLDQSIRRWPRLWVRLGRWMDLVLLSCPVHGPHTVRAFGGTWRRQSSLEVRVPPLGRDRQANESE